MYIIQQLLILSGLCIGFSSCRDCVKKDMCSCEFDDRSGVVDLTSLGNSDNTPRFQDVWCKADQWYYSYNPCGGFVEQECSDVALCGLMKDKTEVLSLGKADSVMFKYDDDSHNVQAGYLIVGTPIMYVMNAFNPELSMPLWSQSHAFCCRTAEIEMICDTSACEPEFIPVGRKQSTLFKMKLRSICACPGLCSASGPTQGCSPSSVSLSTGSFILIGLGGCILCYLCIGMTFQRLHKHARGTDIIPNKAMWMSLAVHIKRGFTMVFCMVRGRSLQYDEI